MLSTEQKLLGDFKKALDIADAQLVIDLLNQGANPNWIFPMGNTPLHVAVGRGNIEVLDALLGAGALVDSCDEQGRTAFEYALDLASRPGMEDFYRRVAQRIEESRHSSRYTGPEL
jgi:ankyrin repeat protein